MARMPSHSLDESRNAGEEADAPAGRFLEPLAPFPSGTAAIQPSSPACDLV